MDNQDRMDMRIVKAYDQLKGCSSLCPELGTMNICQIKHNSECSTKNDGNFI